MANSLPRFLRRRSPGSLHGAISRLLLLCGVVGFFVTSGIRRVSSWVQPYRSGIHPSLTALSGAAREPVLTRPAVDVDSFDLQSYLSFRKELVDEALDYSLQSHSPYTEKIIGSMKYSLLAGGKRIRPVMVLAAYEMIAGADRPAESLIAARANAMPTAVAVEMLHTLSLIHDDLPAMDNDALRRGVPTSHVKFGEEIAILAGDALLSEAFVHISRHTPKSVEAERVLAVISRLGDAVGPVGLVGGQVMDLECEHKQCATLEELRWIHTHKTGALFEAAVVSGATLAGASEAEVEACEKYARNVGLAFQVADDILDVTQTSDKLGKTAGKDVAADKTTYVKLLGIEGARLEGERLYTEAVSSLSIFGDRAAPLIGIADYILKRTN